MSMINLNKTCAVSVSNTGKQNQTLLLTWVADAHLQCVNNHYTKFEYKGMKSVWIAHYTQINVY